MGLIRLSVLVFVFVMLTAAARAELLTLVCTDNRGETWTIDIDTEAQTVCWLTSAVRQPSCQLTRAQISDRYISFSPNNRIDRITGMIRWTDGGVGRCQRMSKQF